MNNKDDLPYDVDYYNNGNIRGEYWNNKRDGDLPDCIVYYENGKVEIESWKNKRDNDLPCEIYYYDNGNIETKIWSHGRDFGPKIIHYNKDGIIDNELFFYWNGEDVFKEEYYKLKVIVDLEKELEESIPVNTSIGKVVKF